jgi:hypothetical protein
MRKRIVQNTFMMTSIASEIRKIAAILKQQPIPFYGLLSEQQWDALGKFCQNKLEKFWKDKHKFFEKLYAGLIDDLFDGKEPTHAEMMPVLNFLKFAPHTTDPKLKHFLSTIKIEQPKDNVAMDLKAFRSYMSNKTELSKMQKKSSLSIYDEKHPVADEGKFIANGVCYLTFPKEAANKETKATELAKDFLTKKYGNKVNVNYFDKKSTLGSYTESFNQIMADPNEYAINYTVEK